MKYPCVSIIIPVYNAEKYLLNCLSSATKQTLTNIEIIVINDASTDSSLGIIKKFKKTDKRIKLINFHENKGNGIGRNVGIKKSTGDYILFLDADDWLEQNAAERLYQAASVKNAEIVHLGYFQHNTKSEKCDIILPCYSGEDKDFLRYFLLLIKGFTSMPWCYFYSRDFLVKNEIKFTEGIFFEDVNFVAKAFFCVRRLTLVNDYPLYNYLIHKDSITGSLSKKKIRDLFEAHIILKKILKEENLFCKYEKEYLVRFLVYCVKFSYLGFLKLNNKQVDDELKKFMTDVRKSEILNFGNLDVLKLAAREYKYEKLAAKYFLSTYNFLVSIRKNYHLFSVIYKIKYYLKYNLKIKVFA